MRLLSLSNVAKIGLLFPNLLKTGQCDCKSLKNQEKGKKKKVMGYNVHYLLSVLKMTQNK